MKEKYFRVIVFIVFTFFLAWNLKISNSLRITNNQVYYWDELDMPRFTNKINYLLEITGNTDKKFKYESPYISTYQIYKEGE